MANINFHRGEKGEVYIYDIPIDEHRELCQKYKLEPDIYLSHFAEPNTFYRSVNMSISGVSVHFYSKDTSIELATGKETGVIMGIKKRLAEIQREREAEESDD